MEFNLEEILDMINNKGMMLKEICEVYGCNRHKLYYFLKKHNLTFKNNPNARKNQSKLMNGDMNPTKGRKRTKEEMEGINKANREKAQKEWDKKFKNGILYHQYAKICRQRAYTNMNKVSKKDALEIDHIYSLKDCWTNRIHPIYASDIANLQTLTPNENKLKSDRSDMELMEFLGKINAKELSEVQFNWPKL